MAEDTLVFTHMLVMTEDGLGFSLYIFQEQQKVVGVILYILGLISLLSWFHSSLDPIVVTVSLSSWSHCSHSPNGFDAV
jgi:hypothetical protein